MYQATDEAHSTLASGILATDTSMTIGTGHGNRFPVIVAPDQTTVTITDGAGNKEHVKVLARALGSDTFTSILRGQDGTTARAWSSGVNVDLNPTAAVIMDKIGLTDTRDAATKSTLADADVIPVADSATSYSLKGLTWAILKANIKTYCDTLYSAATGIFAAKGANTDITSLASPAIGAATATTAAANDNSTNVATTAQVQAAIQQTGMNSQGVKTIEAISAGVPSNGTGNDGDIRYQY